MKMQVPRRRGPISSLFRLTIWFAVFHTFDPESRNYVTSRTGRGPIYEHPNVPDDAYCDGQVTRLTIDKLREFEQRQEPFFLAAGFSIPISH